MKKIIKISRIAFFILLPLFLILGLIELVGGNLINKDSDIDLEDFSIKELSDEDIVNGEKSRSYQTSNEYAAGTRSGVTNASKYVDSDSVNFSCREIVGVKTVSATKAENCTLKLTISSSLNDGFARIVVIRDDEIAEYVGFGEKTTLTYEVSGEHIYRVKILCEDAKLEIKVERSFIK